MRRKREQRPACPAGRVTFRPGDPVRGARPARVRPDPDRAPAPGRPVRRRRRPGPGSGLAARHWSRPPDGPAYNCTPGRSTARPVARQRNRSLGGTTGRSAAQPGRLAFRRAGGPPGGRPARRPGYGGWLAQFKAGFRWLSAVVRTRSADNQGTVQRDPGWPGA